MWSLLGINHIILDVHLNHLMLHIPSQSGWGYVEIVPAWCRSQYAVYCCTVLNISLQLCLVLLLLLLLPEVSVAKPDV